MLLLLLLFLFDPAPAAAATWRPPVGGAEAGAFTYDARTPYLGGRRRGLAWSVTDGARVAAACAGRVTFAGTVPFGGRVVDAVSVRCGALTATHLPLAALAVRRGTVVRRGARLGAAAGPTLQLGARRGRRYVDPATLLGAEPPALPVVPWGTAPRPERPRPVDLPVPAARPQPASVPVPRPFGAVAAAGVGLLALGTGAGGVVRARRRAVTRTGAPVVRR